MSDPASPCKPATVWLTERELAVHLHVSIRHLANLRKAGMPFVQLGASVRFDIDEVERYLRSNRRLSSHVQRQKRRAALAAGTLRKSESRDAVNAPALPV